MISFLVFIIVRTFETKFYSIMKINTKHNNNNKLYIQYAPIKHCYNGKC